MLLHYLVKRGNTKITFFTQMVYYSRALQQLDCVFCTHSAPVRCLPERKIVICDVFDSVYIC